MFRSKAALVVLAVLAVGACGGGEARQASAAKSDPGGQKTVGPFGPSLGEKAPVVDSASLTTTGEVAIVTRATSADGQTSLFGQCDPTRFANFGVEMKSDKYARIEVTLTSAKPIPTGTTGEFRLPVLDVTFTTPSYDQQVFRGPGTLTLTRHDASSRARRMVGTMSGQALKRSGGGGTLDATFEFDLAFSCGVTP
jgi:hypothetical protein